MPSPKYNLYVKIGAIIVITLLLLIPTAMLQGLIEDRESVQRSATNEVSAKWGEQQVVLGPLITIPFYRYVREISPKDSSEKLVRVKDYVHVLPSQLHVSGDIYPEKRYRGIYEIVVYNAKFSVTGTFDAASLYATEIAPEQMLFDEAELVMGISDLRGIEKPIYLQWDGEEIAFNPGVSSQDVVVTGVNASLNLRPEPRASHRFAFSVDINGSELLHFTPVGKTTDVKLSSVWSNPSFNGAFLPDQRQVTPEGFGAHWNVLHLNRNYPQRWTGPRHNLQSSAFGVDLRVPVANYQKSHRTIRYAILFIGFTFLSFFFIEVLNRVLIHPVQYILVGMALIVFYTLLISLSEHISFNLAFIISALATLLLIGGYMRAILRSARLTFFMLGMLTVLYSFIFVIIQLQDYALLIGSFGIFAVLGLMMYYSRKIDWYALTLDKA